MFLEGIVARISKGNGNCALRFASQLSTFVLAAVAFGGFQALLLHVDTTAYAAGAAVEPAAAEPAAVESSPSSSVAPEVPAAPPKADSAAHAPASAERLAKVQSLLDAKRFTEALGEIEFILKSDPKNAEVLKSRGFALRETGKHKDAVQSYIDALKINPQLHVAKEYLAVTYLRMGETKSAKQLYAELKKDAPELAKMLLAEAKRLKLKL
jgi:tetratricopeptide (TPR) repeat protein